MSIKELPKAIFWDWDGTLVDSYGFLNDAHNHTLTTLGFKPFEDGEYKQYFGKPRDVLYPAIYKEKAQDALPIFQEYVLNNSDKVRLLEGAKEVIEYLASLNIPMGIVSNKKSLFIKEELGHLGWLDKFLIVIGSGDAEADKPSGAPLKYAIDQCGLSDVEVSDIWYVGDTENDLACAEHVGCTSLFLTGDEYSESLIQTYQPSFCFAHHRELKDFLVAI